MSFFLPRRLVELEYLVGDSDGPIDTEYEQLAESYRDDIDFAFYFVNFGTTKAEYLELTKREKYFIRKAHENKIVQENTLMRNAVLNAVGNAMRKKNQKFIDLWKKGRKELDKDLASNNLKIITEVEETEGKSWVDKIYHANNLRRPGKEE